MIPARLGVVWRRDELLPYESIWSVLHKFCRWNAASFEDVWTIFGVRAYSELPRSQVCRSQSGLHNPRWLDLAKIQSTLGLTPVQTRDLFPARYVPIKDLEYRPESDVRTLQYCPQCMELGFHTALHQLGFIEICPIHQCRLATACPSCGGPIRYNAPIGDAFACTCGHPLWMGRRCRSLQPEEVACLSRYVTWTDALARGCFGPRNGDDAVDLQSFAVANVADDSICSTYQAFLTRINSLVGDARGANLPVKSGKPRPGHVALFAWRTFWESVSPKGQLVALDSVRRRLTSIYAWAGPVSADDVRRAAAGAVLGTFVECWDKAMYAASLSQATGIARSMTGAFIPAATPAPSGSLLAPRSLKRMLKRHSEIAIRELLSTR